MHQRPGDEHLIEMLPADEAAWGPTSPDAPPPVGRTRPRRRTVLAAGVAAVAVVAGAVVAVQRSGSGDDGPEAAPTTTVVGEDGSSPADGTSPYFVIDDPALRTYSADVVTPRSTDARFWIWSQGTARGPWLSLQLRPAPDDQFVFPNAARRVVAGQELITFRDPPFATEVVVGDGRGPAVLVHGVGIPGSDLSALAGSITATADDVAFDESIMQRLGLTLTTQARWSSELLYGAVDTQMSALTEEGSLVVLRVAAGRRDTRPATLAFLADGPITDGDGYTSARFPATGESIVTWSQGGHLLSLVGPVSPRALLRMARTVRRAPVDEWRQLLYGLHPDYRIGEFTALGTGAGTATDRPWQAGVQLAERDGRTVYLWWWTRTDDVERSAARLVDGDLATAPRLDTVVVEGVTYVFVSVPADDPAQRASVHLGDGSIVDVPLTRPFPGVPVRMGATRTEVPGDVSAWFGAAAVAVPD